MISISIISPLKSMAVIDKAIEHNDFGCVFHRYVYENLEEIKDIYEQCKDISDVLFFSGELGYSYILTHVDDLKVPCTFISYTEKTLLSILLNFVIHYPDVPLNRLYIDFLTPVNDFMNLKKYLDPEHMPYCFENPVYNYETLKERAVELWKEKKIDMMFTRTTNQLEVLNKLQIPYIHFLPTEEMVRDINTCLPSEEVPSFNLTSGLFHVIIYPTGYPLYKESIKFLTFVESHTNGL